jgi:hypothetical protein
MTAVACFFMSNATAHEMVPAYPELSQSYIDGIFKTDIMLFNRRNDVSYYEIQVFDNDWNGVAFASESKIVRLDYLERKNIEVYIRKKDKDKVTYICTQSKLIKSAETSSKISSKICSKIKRDE